MSADSPLDRVLDAQDQVRIFLDSAHSCVVAVDGDELITYVNARAVETFGYEPTELIGRPVEQLIPVNLTDEERAQREQLRLSLNPRRVDLKFAADVYVLAKDGRKIPVEIRLTPLRLADGGVWTVAGITDLSARVVAQERSRTMGRAYRTLAQLNQAIVRAPDARTLYDETCRIAVEVGGYLGAWVGTVRPDGAVRPVACSPGVRGYVDALDITVDPHDPRGLGPSAVALREGRACFSPDFVHDPRTAPWHALAVEHGVHASASLPLREAGAPVAVLNLYAGVDGTFADGVGELYEQVADNVSYALDGFAAAERLAEVAAQRSHLLQRLATAEETERARIAGDIHDDSVQALAAIELRLGLVRRKLAERGSTADLVALLDPIQEGLVATTRGLRSLLFELEPPAHAESCASAVRSAAEHVFEDHPIQWQVDGDDDVRLPDIETAQALRIVKEALINVRTHAQASRVDVRVRNAETGVEVEVTDDGVGPAPGVDPDELRSRPGHRGMSTMRDRAALTGGWLRLERAPSGGTTLRFFIPRDPSA
ncbi:MAG: sensor histidine kinase [Nocardioides sp.]